MRDGEAVLKVKKVIDKDQAWFWTDRWQQGERQAEGGLRAGRIQHFADAGSAIDFLHSETRKKPKKASV